MEEILSAGEMARELPGRELIRAAGIRPPADPG
jgi:hypothetical protein